jgi:flagellar motor switch protein FliN/FliY
MTEKDPDPQANRVSAAAEAASPLDLLLDVQLEATIRFGERQMLLREVLSAAPGSILELDRELADPADLLVAGRLIARGEVVVVDGRFGLRITELAAPQRLPLPA